MWAKIRLSGGPADGEELYITYDVLRYGVLRVPIPLSVEQLCTFDKPAVPPLIQSVVYTRGVIFRNTFYYNPEDGSQ